MTNTMLTTKFGIEIEFTGITRETAAKTAAEFLHGTYQYIGSHYRTYTVTQPDGRVWKFMSDGSIHTQRMVNGEKVSAGKEYSVEMVSPILTYREDIETLQGLIRVLRKAGGFSDTSCGIHIHLDGADHTPRSIRNFVNIIASKNDLLYEIPKPINTPIQTEYLRCHNTDILNIIALLFFKMYHSHWRHRNMN